MRFRFRLLPAVLLLLAFFAAPALAQNPGQIDSCPIVTKPRIISDSSVTLTSSDKCWILVLTNSGSITVNLPAPGLMFPPGWAAYVLPINGGTVTFAGLPDQAGNLHKINQQNSLLLAQGIGARVLVMQDSNWWAVPQGGISATQSGVNGPNSSTSGNAACWNNGAGTLLKDCGPPITGPGSSVSGDVACWNNGVGTNMADCGLAVARVATYSAQKTLAGGVYPVLYRQGYLSAGDGGDGWYIWNGAATCTDDIGSCIQPNSGAGRWVLIPGKTVDVRQFGARGDAGYLIGDGSMTSGGNVLTSVSCPFTSLYVGRNIVVQKAGPSQGALQTTVSSFTDACHINLNANASQSVSGVNWAAGHDDTAAITNAGKWLTGLSGSNANTFGGKLVFPPNQSFLVWSTASWGGVAGGGSPASQDLISISQGGDIAIDMQGATIVDGHNYGFGGSCGTCDGGYIIDDFAVGGSNYTFDNIKVVQIQSITIGQGAPSGATAIALGNNVSNVIINNVQCDYAGAAFQFFSPANATPPNKGKAVQVNGGYSNSCVYGVAFANNGDNSTVRNFDTNNVDRSAFMYGVDNLDISIRSTDAHANDIYILPGGDLTNGQMATRNIRLNYITRPRTTAPGPSLVTLNANGGGGVIDGVMENIKINLDVDASQDTGFQEPVVKFIKQTTGTLASVWANIEITGRIKNVQNVGGHILDLFTSSDASWANETIKNIRVHDLYIDGSTTPDIYIDVAGIVGPANPIVFENVSLPGSITVANNTVGGGSTLQKVLWHNVSSQNTTVYNNTAMAYSQPLVVRNDPSASGPGVDFSNSTVSIVSGSISTSLATGSGMVMLTDNSTGDTAMYLLGDLTVAFLGETGTGEFVSPTCSPASGKTSVCASGGLYYIVNNTGATHTFTVGYLRTRSSN